MSRREHAKITAYDFYHALENLTDATNLQPPPDRYQPVEGMHWEVLRGRPPASSRWEKSSSCIYIFFLAIDACFRLKRRAISNELRDPGLGTGWAYMVEWAPYHEYLANAKDQKEISSCSGLAALDHANTKFSRGYSATGVAMGVCARHEFVQPTGVSDLQVGERYVNMDYVFASIIRHLHLALRLMVSYHIACQWAKNLAKRLAGLPSMLRLNLVLALIRFVVPKLHIQGHTLKCQLLYSLNWVPGGGQVDGEGIERPWSMIGGVAASTRVSGPSARADLLDDHWSFWNWSKLVGLPKLRRRLNTAIQELARQEESFKVFSEEQAEHVPRWKAMVEAFEANGNQPNPYEPTMSGLMESQVRKHLDQEDANQVATGCPMIHDISPSAFVVELLKVEAEQRRVSAMVDLKRSNSTTMKINMRRLCRSLNKRIARLRTLQATYTPAALQHLSDLDLPQDTVAERVLLLPPSGLTALQRSNGGCVAGLLELEQTLREAQCRAALVSLQNQLHVKYRLLLYKSIHSRNQLMNTRSRTLVSRNESKILFTGGKCLFTIMENYFPL
ncbi:hypothetical protein C8F01DRAFT_1265921 [Mycena amicta]|nr:hypothetical protein C8F01DRAFT_1265921 [Mycena amicta]